MRVRRTARAPPRLTGVGLAWRALGRRFGAGASVQRSIHSHSDRRCNPNWLDELLDPSAPLDAIKSTAPRSIVRYDAGAFPARAAAPIFLRFT